MDTDTSTQRKQLAAQLNLERRGHFELESGHHGERWYDLELLYRNPEAMRPLSQALADRLSRYEPEIICGPLVERAFVALQVATALRLEFAYAERQVRPNATGLFPVQYRLPGALRQLVSGRRVALVNDLINAGSAVLGTLSDLRQCGAKPVALGALMVLGEAAQDIANTASLPLLSLVTEPNVIFTPDECPLCKEGRALVPHPGS